jgi:hypothetical protein
VDADSKALVKELKDAGLSEQAIMAAWPSWWDDEAASSISARAELRFALSRNLGLAPQSLLGERVEFVWHDEARFKNLGVADAFGRCALASFGVAAARILLRATPPGPGVTGVQSGRLREAILSTRAVVDLFGLLTMCWGLGIRDTDTDRVSIPDECKPLVVGPVGNHLALQEHVARLHVDLVELAQRPWSVLDNIGDGVDRSSQIDACSFGRAPAHVSLFLSCAVRVSGETAVSNT